MEKRILLADCLIMAALVLTGCGGRNEVEKAAPHDSISVCVSILPLAYIAERVGGENLDITVLVSPGQSPHTFELSPKQMTALGEAKFLFTTNMPFENALKEKMGGAFPHLAIVNAAEGVQRRTMDGCSHCGDSEDGHFQRQAALEELDPHVWLSPANLKVMAENIAESFIEFYPGNMQYYNDRLMEFQSEIDSVDNIIRETLKTFQGSTFYVFHPAFGYFAEAYNLKQKAVEVGGKSPSPRQLGDLISSARRDSVRVIFVQPQFDRRAAQMIAEAIGGKVIPLDPLSMDVLRNLENIAVQIAAALDN